MLKLFLLMTGECWWVWGGVQELPRAQETWVQPWESVFAFEVIVNFNIKINSVFIYNNYNYYHSDWMCTTESCKLTEKCKQLSFKCYFQHLHLMILPLFTIAYYQFLLNSYKEVLLNDIQVPIITFKICCVFLYPLT